MPIINVVMNQRVSFEDNIFILVMRIRMIRDIITLDADPEIFLEKLLDDIYFSDQVLRILLECLQENNYLIDRSELLDHLSDLELQFSHILLDFLEHEGKISIREIPSIREKLAVCRNSSLQRRKVIEDLNSTPDNLVSEPVVGSDELTELLKAF